MRSYYAYGLRIVSNLSLPELPTITRLGPHDLKLRFTTRACGVAGPSKWAIELSLDSGHHWLRSARVAGGYLLRVDDASLMVRIDGRQIVCFVPPRIELDDANLRHLVLDQVMPLVFKLRGEEALHASAVHMRAGVAAFIGPGGSGKSTLAAGFLGHGYPVVSDDCLRTVASTSGAHVWPAYPGVRLLADALTVMSGGRAESVGAGRTKRRWMPADMRASFPTRRMRLVRIYRLMPERRGLARLGPALSARDAFVELAASTFRFDALDRPMLRREVDVWDHVARTVPMRRLWVERGLASSGARALVLGDLR